MATPNLSSALDRPASSVEKPKPAPQGSYVFIISGMPRYDKSSKKQTDFVEFTCKYQTAMDDVDEDDLKTWLTNKDGSTKVLHEQTTKLTFYITDGALWRLKQFLGHIGWELGTDDEPGPDADKSLREMIEQSMNRSFVGFIKHEPSEDGQSVFAKIDRTAAVEE